MVFLRELSFKDVWPPIDPFRREMYVLEDDFLTDEQKKITARSYNSGSHFYQTMYEASTEMSARTEADYLMRFRNITKALSPIPTALILGSGNGNDTLRLLLDGINAHAVDYSQEMMKGILWHFSKEGFNIADDKRFKSTVSDIMDLPADFASEDFESILVDSCFQHLNKSSVPDFLRKALPWLKPGGAILFRLKVTEHGKAYVIHDGVGTRYYTSWTLEEIEELKAYLVSIGYEISTDPEDNLPITPHKDTKAGTPDFYPIVIRKPLAVAN